MSDQGLSEDRYRELRRSCTNHVDYMVRKGEWQKATDTACHTCGQIGYRYFPVKGVRKPHSQVVMCRDCYNQAQNGESTVFEKAAEASGEVTYVQSDVKGAKLCGGCGRHFLGRPRSKTCSNKCYHRVYRGKKMDRRCVFCGTALSPDSRANKQYCSDCRKAGRRAYHATKPSRPIQPKKPSEAERLAKEFGIPVSDVAI